MTRNTQKPGVWFAALFGVLLGAYGARGAEWVGGASDDNWSTLANWFDNASPSDKSIVFNNTDTTTTTGTVNNIVDTDYKITSLIYTNDSALYHTTQIENDHSLSTAAFQANGNATATTNRVDFTGGGSFLFTNTAGIFKLSGAASQHTTVNMSSLASLTITASRIDLGQYGAGRVLFTLAQTNQITATELRLGYGSHFSDTLFLGAANTLTIDKLAINDGSTDPNMGGTAAQSTLRFTSGLTNPSVVIRNKAGSGGATLNMAWRRNFGVGLSTISTIDLRGGTIDALFGTVQMGWGREVEAEGPGTASLYFDKGTINITAATLGKASVVADACRGEGLIDVSGTGELTIETLILGDKTGTGLNNNARGYVRLGGSGILRATTITHGATNGVATRRIEFTSGTIANRTNTDLTVSSAVTLLLINTNAHIFDIATGHTGTVHGAIAESGGPAGLIKTGKGTLIFNSTNTYTGVTQLREGQLHILKSVMDVAAVQDAIASDRITPRNLVVTDIGTYTRLALPPAGMLLYIL